MDVFWPGEADIDYYQTLTVNEKQLLMFKKISPQLEYRSELVSWISNVCRLYKLCRPTEHLAVTLMDLFMDVYKIGVNQLMLLALSCISVAAKCEEREEMIPHAGHMIPLVDQHVYDESICLKMEMKILQYFDWRVHIPTVALFVDFLMNDSSFVDLPLHNHMKPELAVSLEQIRYTIEELHDIVLQDVEFRVFLPSLVASAMVFVTRYHHNIQPLWPLRLVEKTGYSQDKLSPTVIGTLSQGLMRAQTRVSARRVISPANSNITYSSTESGYGSSEYTTPPVSPPTLVTP